MRLLGDGNYFAIIGVKALRELEVCGVAVREIGGLREAL